MTTLVWGLGSGNDFEAGVDLDRVNGPADWRSLGQSLCSFSVSIDKPDNAAGYVIEVIADGEFRVSAFMRAGETKATWTQPDPWEGLGPYWVRKGADIRVLMRCLNKPGLSRPAFKWVQVEVELSEPELPEVFVGWDEDPFDLGRLAELGGAV